MKNLWSFFLYIRKMSRPLVVSGSNISNKHLIIKHRKKNMMNNYIWLPLFVTILRRFFFLKVFNYFFWKLILDENINASDVAKKLYEDLMHNYDKRVNRCLFREYQLNFGCYRFVLFITRVIY